MTNVWIDSSINDGSSTTKAFFSTISILDLKNTASSLKNQGIPSSLLMPCLLSCVNNNVNFILPHSIFVFIYYLCLVYILSLRTWCYILQFHGRAFFLSNLSILLTGLLIVIQFVGA